MSSMVWSPWVSSFSLLVAQPASATTASTTASRSIQIQDMGTSETVIDPAPLGVVVDGEWLLDMHGDLGARLDVDGGECLAVELVHPLRHLLHPAGQDAAHGLVGGDAYRSDRSVAADVGHP